MSANRKKSYDVIIIGGGFFGVSLALFLGTITKKVILIERENDILNRSSKYNQARVHTGFHYPRSAITAVKSLLLHKKFEIDFPNAIVGDVTLHVAASTSRFFDGMTGEKPNLVPVPFDACCCRCNILMFRF